MINKKANPATLDQKLLKLSTNKWNMLNRLFTIILIIISAVQSAGFQQVEIPCYLKNSSCSACYTLCYNQSINDLPSQIRECLLKDNVLDLAINQTIFQNIINIKYLILLDDPTTNSCQLNRIRITQTDFQKQMYKISITREFLQGNQLSPDPNNFDNKQYQQALIQNVEFQFDNLHQVDISNINFSGNQIRKTSTLILSNITFSVIQNSNFFNSTLFQQNGAALAVYNQTFISIHNTLFKKNQVQDNDDDPYSILGGSAIYLTDYSLLHCFDCTFLENEANCSQLGGQGGAILLENNAKIETCQNCIFTGNKARIGGAVSMTEGSQFFDCFNCIFDNNQAYSFGGAIHLEKNSIISLFSYTIFKFNQQLKPSKFNELDGGGAAVYLTKNSIFSHSQYCNFYNNNAKGYGSCVLINDRSVYSESPYCNFSNNTAEQKGGAIYAQSNSFYRNSPNCSFINNSAYYGGSISLQDNSIYENSSNCMFKNNMAVSNGGAIYLNGNSVYSNSPSCVFINNSAANGGSIYININSVYQNCEKSSFCDNFVIKFGGAIFLQQYSTYQNSPYCKFQNNSALSQGGSIYIQDNSIYQNSPNCIFLQNSAIQGGAIYINSYSSYQNSSNCNFESNKALYFGGAVCLQSLSKYQNSHQCTFQSNTANTGGGALLIFFESQYSNSVECQFMNNQALMYGGAIYLIQSSYRNSENSIFSQNIASVGGALYLERYSIYQNSPNSYFYQNFAFNYAGAIFLYNSSVYLNSENSTFYQNKAQKYGGSIAIIKNNYQNISISYTNFTNNSADQGGGIYSDLSSNILFNHTNFINNIAQQENGGALYFGIFQLDISLTILAKKTEFQIFQEEQKQDNIKFQQVNSINLAVQVNIQNCQFIYNQAISKQGGAVFIKSDTNPSNITIQSSLFDNNYAGTGGAISIQAVLFTSIVNNTFYYNTAKFQGGAIFFQILGYIYQFIACKDEVCGILSEYFKGYSTYQVQNPFLIQNNVFKLNQAQQVSGAISLDFSKAFKNVVGDIQNNIFDISDQNNITLFTKTSCLINNTFISNSAKYAGAAIRINGFTINQIVNESQYANCAYLQKIINQSQNILNNNSSPLYKQHTLQSFSFQEYLNQSEILCSCLYGERLSLNTDNEAYYCDKCQINTYLKQTNERVLLNQPCIQCPQGFECPGGYESLKILQGYWSSTDLSVLGNDQSIVAYPCNLTILNQSTCLGYSKCFNSNSQECSENSVCLINYVAPACLVCNEKQYYFPAGLSNTCSLCGSNAIIILKCVGITVIILIFLYLSIQSTCDKIQKQLIIKTLRIGFDQIIANKDQLTALMRILTNYFQNISFFFSLQIQVPEYIKQYFLLLENIGQPLGSFSNSLQCLFKNFQIQSAFQKQFYLLFQFTLSLALPTILLVMIYFTKYIFYKIFNGNNNYKPVYLIILPTYIYIYLQFLPTLFYNSLSFLTCRTIAGEYYLIGDSKYQCKSLKYGLYSRENLLIAVSVLIYQLSVPIVLLIILVRFKNKNLLNRPFQISTSKYQLGYLYLGYKQSCYYWEIIRIFQRILIITTYLVLYDFNGQKISSIVLILILYTVLTNHFKPNDNIKVEKVEFYSNHVQIFTFISGSLLQQFTYSWIQNIFFYAVLLLNMSFLIYIFTHMLLDFQLKIKIVFNRYRYFQRFKFVRKILENEKKKNIILKKWIRLSNNIRKIIQIGLKISNEIFQQKESVRNLQATYQDEEEQAENLLSNNLNRQNEYKEIDNQDREFNLRMTNIQTIKFEDYNVLSLQLLKESNIN